MKINITTGYLPSYATQKKVFRIRNRISTGYAHGLFLHQDGKIYSWGLDGSAGVLGRSASASSPLPTYLTPVDLGTNMTILQLASSYYSNIILAEDAVYTWGKNDYGLDGDGTASSISLPIKMFSWDLQGPKIIDQVAAGPYTFFALDEYGKVFGWGRNDYGQLGDRTTITKYRPVDMYMKGALLNETVVKICGGVFHTLMLTASNGLFATGDNTYGQLGAGKTSSVLPNTLEAVRVEQNNTLKGKTVVDIACGEYHSLVLTSDGKIYSWGYNANGQVGDNTVVNKLEPTAVDTTVIGTRKAIKIFTKFSVSFAILTNGASVSWGANTVYQLGHSSGYSTYRATPYEFSFPAGVFPVEYSMLYQSTVAIGSNGNIYGSGYSSANAELLTLTTTQSSFTLAWRFPVNNVVMERRHYPFFQVGQMTYYFLGNQYFSFPDNGFDVYYRNSSKTTAWSIATYQNTTSKAFPGSIYNTHILRVNTYIYFFGGFVNSTISNAIYRAPTSDVLNGWEVVVTTLPYPVASGMAILLDDFFYVFGGLTSYTDNPSTGIPSVSATSKIIRCHVSSPTQWEVMDQSLPAEIYSGSITRVNDYVYIFGGRNTPGDAFADILRAPYLSVTSWENTYATLPFPVCDGPMVITDDSIFLFGGYSSELAPNVVGKMYQNVIMAKKDDPVGSWTVSGDSVPVISSTVNTAVNIPEVVGSTLYLYGNDGSKVTSFYSTSPSVHTLYSIALN